MPEYVETWDDLNRKYSGTYIKYKGALCHCSNFSDKQGIKLVCTTLGPRRGLKEEVYDYEESLLAEIHVDACLFNRTDGKKWSELSDNSCVATMLWRSPRRQWKRSLCQHTIQLMCPVEPIYAAIGRTPKWDRKLNLNSVQDLLNAEYPSVDEGFKLLDRFVCLAIGPSYCFARSTISSKKALVGSKFGFIGEFHPDDGFTIYHAPAIQEVKDFLQRTKQYYQVLLNA